MWKKQIMYLKMFLIVVISILIFVLLFGKENLFIGLAAVITVTTMFGEDYTINPIHHTLYFIGVELFVGLGAYFAGLNPILGAIMTLIVSFFIYFSFTYDTKPTKALGFIQLYLFLLYEPVTTSELPKRVFALILGGIVIMTLYYTLARYNFNNIFNKSIKGCINSLIENLNELINTGCIEKKNSEKVALMIKELEVKVHERLELEKKHWKYYAINQIQYEELRDSINLIKQTESIRKMESLYDYHQAESKFLKAKILLDKMKIRYLYMCLFGGICLICVVMGAICVYFSLKRKKMKLCEQRERLFALKKKRDEDQIRLEHNEKMIQCLEKQLEESSMAYTEKDKELMALQKLKLEAENQTLKCVKTEKQLLIEEFCMSDIYYRFHLKEEWRPKEEDWDELFKAIDNTYDNFTHRLMGVAPRLTMTELRVSCLIKANVPPVTIAMLIVTTPTNVSMIRKRLYDKIHSEKGSSEKFDKFIRDF